jgi:chaperonin cofactor prefoldin
MGAPVKKKSNKKIPLIIFGAALAGFVVYGRLTNHLSDQWFLDRIAAANFQPSAEIVELVEKSYMNDEARTLFYASRPELNDRTDFNRNCAELLNEASMILGCYNGQIFIFDISDERIKGAKYVTAAHEMLHAAYDRLGIFEKNRINQLISEQLKITDDPNVLEQLEMYGDLEPGQEINEMHSVLGTEGRNLPPELEKYYARYFVSRSSVVAEHEKYKAVFDQLEKRAEDLEQKAAALETEISSLRLSYEIQAEKLSQDVDNFNYNASIGNYFNETDFYARRTEIIGRQSALSRQVDKINLMIDEYNSYVAELQALGRDAEILQKSLDSKEN